MKTTDRFASATYFASIRGGGRQVATRKSGDKSRALQMVDKSPTGKGSTKRMIPHEVAAGSPHSQTAARGTTLFH